MFSCKKTVMLLLGSVLSSHLLAWPASINWTEDNEGTGDRKIVNATVDSVSANVARCEVSTSSNFKVLVHKPIN
jgi:hypothetical protein